MAEEANGNEWGVPSPEGFDKMEKTIIVCNTTLLDDRAAYQAQKKHNKAGGRGCNGAYV